MSDCLAASKAFWGGAIFWGRGEDYQVRETHRGEATIASLLRADYGVGKACPERALR